MAIPPFDRPGQDAERRRLRLCPLCAEAAEEQGEELSACDIHGDPFEGPSAPELQFHALFGRFPWELPAHTV